MGIYIPPQGDITINESAIKNTDAEIRDGVWADSTKAHGANVSYIYANTSTLIKNTSLILVMGSNDATLANQSLILTDGDNLLANTSLAIGSNATIDSIVDLNLANTSTLIQYNNTIDAVVDYNLANSSTIIGQNATIDDVVDNVIANTSTILNNLSSGEIGDATIANQSLALVDGNNIIANTSLLITSNATMDTVVDAIQAVTDLLPNSGALTSIGTLINQSLILVDGDSIIANTSSLIDSNASIDATVDGIKTITDALPNSGALTSLGTLANQSLVLTDGDLVIANTSLIIDNISSGEIGDASLANQSLILVDGDNIIANSSSLITSNSTIDTVVDSIKSITDALPDSGNLTSIGSIANQSLILVDGDNLLSNTSSLIQTNASIDSIVDTISDNTKLLFAVAGNKSIASGVTKYLSIDSGTDGAEIISMTIKGVVGADWTVESYIPIDDAVAAPAANDKRDEDTYLNGEDKGGQLSNIGGIRYNMFLDITNDAVSSNNISGILISYRSNGTLSLAWEA